MPSEIVIGEQRARWKSGKHVGASKPEWRVFVRKGHLERHYRNLPSSEVFNYIPGLGGPNKVWFGEWTPDTAYMEVPNVLDAKGDNDFEQNGVETVTLNIDNVLLKEETGVAGIFRSIKRGYFAPQRGNAGVVGRRDPDGENEWFDVWKDKATQIAIVGGYGAAVFPVFVGLIDDVDLTSRPDRITVTARNMGQFLTDQHPFMDAKHLWVRDPITFCDRLTAQDMTNVATNAEAKSWHGGHPPDDAVDGNDRTTWLSDGHDQQNALEWIDIPLPAGRYINFGVYAAFPNLRMYVSFHTTNDNVPGGAAQAHYGNGEVIGEQWVNNGSGHVPGAGFPYLLRVDDTKEKEAAYNINGGRTIVTGDNSRLRLWFQHLHLAPTDNGKAYVYRAGLRTVKVWDRSLPKEAIKNHWILVDDAVDVVKTVLQWCGITDWNLETTGVRLKDKIVFDRQTFLVDIVRKIAEMTSYVFYMGPPDEFDVNDLSPSNATNKSMGVFSFRQNSALKQNPNPGEAREAVEDTDLLTGIQAKFSTRPLANSIRVRGKEVGRHQAQTDPEHIHPLGADRTRRYQYNYRPVWARGNSNGQANLRRPTLHYDQMIDSVEEARIGCLLIAFRQALESAKGEIQVPFFPPINLDQQILIYDTGTGLSTRIWIVQRSWNFRSGEKAQFYMTVGGSLIDVNDVTQTRAELEEALNSAGRLTHQIARGPWTTVHSF